LHYCFEVEKYSDFVAKKKPQFHSPSSLSLSLSLSLFLQNRVCNKQTQKSSRPNPILLQFAEMKECIWNSEQTFSQETKGLSWVSDNSFGTKILISLI
jgi:hypothetical protein